MNTRFSANRAAEERALFEEAKAKLEEAYVLMRSLESRLDAWDARRGRGAIDEAKRVEERKELLAYVEEAQREALRLARRSRRLSRVRGRAKTPATVEREAAIDDLPAAFDDTDDPSPADDVDPILRADQVERLLDEVAKAVAVATPAGAAPDRGPFALAYPPPADSMSEGGAARLATEAAAIYALASERMERRSTLIEIVDGDVVECADDAVNEIPEDVPEDITDEELVAFEASMTASAAMTAEKWWPAASQSGEAEKAGARMRRDRSPTEIMDRLPLTPLQRLKRFLTTRMMVVVIASAVLGTLIGLTLRAINGSSEDMIDTTTLHLPFVGPPSELAPPPGSAEPTETPEAHTRMMREAKPASSAPAIKAPSKCATAKCRASSSGQAKKTKTAAAKPNKSIMVAQGR